MRPPARDPSSKAGMMILYCTTVLYSVIVEIGASVQIKGRPMRSTFFPFWTSVSLWLSGSVRRFLVYSVGGSAGEIRIAIPRGSYPSVAGRSTARKGHLSAAGEAYLRRDLRLRYPATHRTYRNVRCSCCIHLPCLAAYEVQ